ncbi:unnamed protein product [Meganyctiphanes norvegica]|uniref:VPS9 domain-containing protein n=1 Tax=Meganyctiphanes norvegica TaxID=48144 RepID=A0AAV2QVU8_MEGNR
MLFQNKVIHLLLVDRLLDNALNQDEQYLSNLNHLTYSVTSYTQAEQFLRKFRCHYPLLPELDDKISYMSHVIDPDNDVDVMQNAIQDVLLSCWELLLKKHSHIILADHSYQDLLFRALDFYIVGQLHPMIWPLVIQRCEMVDHLVKTRLGHLRNANLTSIHLGIPSHYYTPLPAAVVEMASLSSRESAVGRLQCLQSSIDLIKAQAKLARVNLHQFKDQDGDPELVLSSSELMALLTTVVVQAQCSSLVSNIYYMTHFVFSVTEDSHLWQSLGLLRKSLEQIMKLDVAQISPISNSMRKELSLQDLMEVSADVESRFEHHSSIRGIGDITALDLQLHQLTQQIQLSTQALSETSLSDRNSPSRRSDRSSLSSSRESSKIHSFREFLASIPSSLRASLRRRQSQQRDAVLSTSLTSGSVYDKLPDFNSKP